MAWGGRANGKGKRQEIHKYRYTKLGRWCTVWKTPEGGKDRCVCVRGARATLAAHLPLHALDLQPLGSLLRQLLIERCGRCRLSLGCRILAIECCSGCMLRPACGAATLGDERDGTRSGNAM